MFPNSIQNLINLLSRLPGLGQRSAARLAIWLLNQPAEDLNNLAIAISNLKTQTNVCQTCFNLVSNGDQFCSICADKGRDHSTICIIEDALDIIPIEKTKCYRGVYHILGGTLAPLDGIGPDKLRIRELLVKIKNNPPKEIILALDSTTEGDTTILYLERTLKPFNLKITRLGRGLSTGSDLEYADEATLSNAFAGRK